MNWTLAGTAVLTRLALRRDRIRLPIWLVGISGLVAATAAGIDGLYPTDAARVENATIRATSVVARAFNGAAPGTGVGALTVSEVMVYAAVLAALLNIVTVVRHTRQNEELGRAELTGSAAVGRHAGLTSALLVAGGADAALAVLTALGMVAVGLPAAGSVAIGVAVGAVGVVFAGIAAVAAQVAESARGATGLACAVLGAAYLLRAVGDAAGEPSPDGLTLTPAWPSWLSPIGWAQQSQPFGAHRWWPFAVFAVFATLAVVLAARLSVHRDVGTGMLPVRRGRDRARARLLSPLGLAWRLQRGVLVGWLVGVVVAGAAFGGIGDQVDDLFAGDQASELMRRLGGGGSLADAYFAAMLGLLGVVVAAYPVQALLRARADESGGPAELMLATAVSRPRWLAAPVACAVAGTGLVLAALGASTGLAYGIVTGNVPAAPGDLLVATLAQLVPTLVLAGFVVAVLGLLPRVAVAVSWAAFAVCLVVGQFGSLFGLPGELVAVSPFTHLPDLPADPLTAGPVLIMLAVAAALLGAGAVAFRRRSLVLQ